MIFFKQMYNYVYNYKNFISKFEKIFKMSLKMQNVKIFKVKFVYSLPFYIYYNYILKYV